MNVNGVLVASFRTVFLKARENETDLELLTLVSRARRR